MAKQIIGININYSAHKSDLMGLVRRGVEAITKTPGLLWKGWLTNDASAKTGGLQLSGSGAAPRNYLKGKTVAAAKKIPMLHNFSVKQFGIDEEGRRSPTPPSHRFHRVSQWLLTRPSIEDRPFDTRQLPDAGTRFASRRADPPRRPPI